MALFESYDRRINQITPVLKKYGIVFDTTVSKVRFNVSGKGYCPRFKLRSYNSTPFELLSHGYVYRTQNAR